VSRDEGGALVDASDGQSVAEARPEVTADAVPADAVPADAVPADVVIPTTLGGDRPAALIVPTAYDPSTPWPLVMLLHGYGASGKLQAAYLGLPQRAESMGFVLLTPDGTLDSGGSRFWNAFPSCCNFEGVEVDDVAYLRGLIDEAKAALSIDATRVFLLGHSNGGFMAYRLACDAAGEITGIATIAGSMSVGAACTPSRPVSVLTIHGTGDDTILFDGGGYNGVPYLGARELVQAWVTRDGCGPPPLVEPKLFDYDLQAAGAETTTTTWPGCEGGARVAFWEMQGSSHIPPFTNEAKDAILQSLLGL
jgi:polyhydroxybutyrate depolymerase